MTREKIIRGLLKNLAALADKKELPLQEVADFLNDLLIEVEDFIDDCKRKASKLNPQITKGKIGN